MARSLRFLALSLGLFVIGSGVSLAGPTTDPAGDWLSTFSGTRNNDLDVVSVEVTFDGSAFVLKGTMAAAITHTGNRYVWGVNRGAGAAGFGMSLGLNGVLFDAVLAITVTVDSSGGITAAGSILGNALAAADFAINGATISARVKASFLPSTGFSLTNYTFNLWPRSPGNGTDKISDFAPNNSNVAATVVPEPSTFAAAGLAAVAGLFAARRRRRSA